MHSTCALTLSTIRRSSVFDLRELFFAGRVHSTCAHLFHRLPCAGRVYSTCVYYSSQVECVRPANIYSIVCHVQVKCIRPASFILRRSSPFDLRTIFSSTSLVCQYTLPFFLYFTINFIMFFPNFSYSKYISQFFITLYRSTCEAFHGFF